MKTDVTPLGESRSLVVKQFKALECSFRVRLQSKEFTNTVQAFLFILPAILNSDDLFSYLDGIINDLNLLVCNHIHAFYSTRHLYM